MTSLDLNARKGEEERGEKEKVAGRIEVIYTHEWGSDGSPECASVLTTALQQPFLWLVCWPVTQQNLAASEAWQPTPMPLTTSLHGYNIATEGYMDRREQVSTLGTTRIPPCVAIILVPHTPLPSPG